MMKHCVIILTIVCLPIIGCRDDTARVAEDPYEQGLSFAADGEFKKALTAFREALKSERDNNPAEGSMNVVERVLSQELDSEAAVYFFKGVRYANRNETLQAFSSLSKALNAAPDFADAYYERALVNSRMKMYDQAVSDYTKTIELNPQDSHAFHNRGLVYARGVKNYDHAIADFSKAIETDPDFAEAYDNRGVAYRLTDKKEKACADWKRACDLGRCRSYDLTKENGYCS